MTIQLLEQSRHWQLPQRWRLGALAKPNDPLRISRLALHSRVHYLLMLLLMLLYGVHVCPFIEALPAHQIGLPLALSLGLIYASRHCLAQEFRRYKPTTAILQRATLVDFLLLQSAGLLYCVYNWSFHSFPLESALKVLFGFLAVGFFTTIDLALQREYCLIRALTQQRRHLSVDAPSLSLMKKTRLFTSISAMVSVVILLLVFVKDLHWLAEDSRRLQDDRALLAIALEALFIAGIVVAYQQRVAWAFQRNLAFRLDKQAHSLAAAREGDYQRSITLVGQDELSAISTDINHTLGVIRQQQDELQLNQDITINALASLAEARDNETGMHILRTQRYVRSLAQHLAQHTYHRSTLTPDYIELLYKSAPLHDIGKVGIPDAILLKPGKLSDDEFAIMKRHTMIGAQALAKAQDSLGKRCGYLDVAMKIAEYHHEKWDGSGYPHGLSGDQIPLPARLMAVADVYDALISERVYKPAFSHQKAMSIILEGRGSHFDPTVVDALLAQEDAFVQIAKEYADQSE